MKKENRLSKIISVLVALCLILSLGTVAFADETELPEAPGGVYVLDEAEVLDLDSENALNSKSVRLKDDADLDFYIVTTADKNGLSLKDYTYGIFDKWNIGGSEDKGIILVLDIEGDSYYLKPGDSIREVFTGTVLQGYLDTYLEGYFAEKEYGQGATELHTAITTLAKNSSLVIAPSEEPEESQSESEPESEPESEAEPQENAGGGFWDFVGGFFKTILIIFLILVVLVVVINLRGQMVKKKRREARAAARRQRQSERKPLSYPEKKSEPVVIKEDEFEEIESSDTELPPEEEEEFEEIESVENDILPEDDDEFIISAFDDIIAKKQAEKSDDFEDIDLNDFDSDEDFGEDEDEE